MTGTGCAEIVRSVLGIHTGSWAENDLNYSDLFIDFEKAVPTDNEKMLYDTAQQIITRGNEILDDLASYGEGPREAAVKALREGPDEEKLQCAAEMEPYIERIKAAYSLSKRVQQMFPRLLWELSSGPLPPIEQLEGKQALLRQFANVIVFARQFDEMKIQNPSMINQFSIYRRLTSTIEPLSAKQDIQSDNDTTWFLANPNSMTGVLLKTAETFVEEETGRLPKENTIDTLYAIIRVCCSMCTPSCSSPTTPSPPFPSLSDETRYFLQRVLVGCVLIFDAIHPQGSFQRESPIDMRHVITVLSKDTDNKQRLLQPLIEHLHHTKKTPVSPKIKALLLAA